jgi:rubredoxin
MNTLKDVSEKAEIINIVNTLIEENGLSPDGEPEPSLKTSRKKPESESVAMFCPKCGFSRVGKNGSAHGKSRFRCKDCGTFFGPTSGKLTEGTSSEKAWDAFIVGMLCLLCRRSATSRCPLPIPGG